MTIVKKMLVHVIIRSDMEIICFIFLRFFVASASATRLEIAIGKPICVREISKKSVGKAIIYTPTPSSPITRATIIRLINPNTLVIIPSMIRIIVHRIKDFVVNAEPFFPNSHTYFYIYALFGQECQTYLRSKVMRNNGRYFRKHMEAVNYAVQLTNCQCM